MKKYKTSEAIAMLEQNPKLIFEDEVRVCGSIGTGKKVRMTVNYCQEIHIDGAMCGVKYGLNTNDQWILVQQPVDFMEAVKAYAEGKTIRCELNGNEYGKMIPKNHMSIYDCHGTWLKVTLNPSGIDQGISTGLILNGKFYVED